MERKIGEIFEYKGDWYQYVKDDMIEYCHGCPSFKDLTCTTGYGSHDCWLEAKCRKLQPVGDPYPLYGHIMQRHTGVTPPVVLPQEPYAQYNPISNTVDIEVKQEPQNTEHMETNTHKTSTDPIRPISPISPTPPTKPTAPATPTKTIPIPDGWEFDRIDDSGNIVLKEKKKELPKTWLKCLRVVNETEYINDSSEIKKQSNADSLESSGCVIGSEERNLLPLGLGKPMLALCQLLVCRDAWWKQLGWKPDWSDRKTLKHCIHSDGWDSTDITRHSTFPRILAFPTEDTAIKFRNTFRDLIEQAKELL